MSDEQAIRDVVQALEDAINGRDWARFFSNFTEDADLIVFESPRAVGRTAAIAMMEAAWSEMPPDVKAGISLASLRLLSEHVAVANLEAEFTGSPPHEDRATAVLSRHGEGWRIEAFRVMQAQGA